MGNVFTTKKKEKKQAFKLFSFEPNDIIIIKSMDNGYRIVSSQNDKSIIVFYENIKKITYDGIYNKGHKHYKKYSLIYKKMDGDFSIIDINVMIDVVTRSCEVNSDSKEIHKIIIDNYETFLIKKKLNCNERIFLE